MQKQGQVGSFNGQGKPWWLCQLLYMQTINK